MSALGYQNRSYDLLALRGAKLRGEQLLAQNLFGPQDVGEVCTGAQKTAQRWVLEFLTKRGSLTFLPARGTDFMAWADRGQLRNESDVRTAFQAAAVQAGDNLRSEEDNSWHPEDRFLEAILLGLAVSDGQVSLQAQISTQAGGTRQVILPLPFPPTELRI